MIRALRNAHCANADICAALHRAALYCTVTETRSDEWRPRSGRCHTCERRDEIICHTRIWHGPPIAESSICARLVQTALVLHRRGPLWNVRAVWSLPIRCDAPPTQRRHPGAAGHPKKRPVSRHSHANRFRNAARRGACACKSAPAPTRAAHRERRTRDARRAGTRAARRVSARKPHRNRAAARALMAARGARAAS